ncbi:hypothetical protein FJ414_10455 [Mesorhizobium sp. B3-1-6]|uniref:hypothetical protein n=1 Tax=Mesorhizobium sp. B3-1-6 TaxID=2589895 RepID=UPI00112ED0A7|nr:hypothetical protein [Mesorhizobium sp. B3-1-6]TPI39497.1 hypothetical protein FJ414_10455 [Mesorhizobium sp. B3-1-6]
MKSICYDNVDFDRPRRIEPMGIDAAHPGLNDDVVAGRSRAGQHLFDFAGMFPFASPASSSHVLCQRIVVRRRGTLNCTKVAVGWERAPTPFSQAGEFALDPIDEPAFSPLLSAPMKTALILVGRRVGKAV